MSVDRLSWMEKLPTGVVTFLFTDVQGSTRLWEDAPDSMMDALRIHDGVIGTAVEDHNGVLVKPRGEGDSQFAVFSSAVDAIEASAQIQRRLGEVDSPSRRNVLLPRRRVVPVLQRRPVRQPRFADTSGIGLHRRLVFNHRS